MQADTQFLKVTVAKTLATLASTPRFTPPVTVDGFIFEHSLPL